MSKEMRSKPDNSWKWMLAITGIITIAVIILSVYAGLNPSGSGDIINSLSGNVSAEAAELLSKAEFAPPALCGFIINPQSETNYFDFVLDTGDDAVVDKEKLTPETKELINYFFLGITLPAREFWVNLNPVELNSIISPMLICTGLGKMLLETDLRLKRDAAMLTDPRLPCGKEYWDVLKAELNAKNLSNVQIPANTRLWIIPADAVIEEDKDNKDKVILVGAKLKVCLESEYDTDLSVNGNTAQSEEDKKIQDIASQAMKKVILPIIEFRVNYSKDYAQLRQIYQSLILAEYFKHKYWGKQSIYESYINTCSIGGLESKEGWSKEAMFDSYIQSMTKGEYSCIQQEYDPAQAAMIKRHYFSGGMQFGILPAGFGQSMTPIGPGVVSAGIGGTGDLIAQATTGAGAGGKVVVEDIKLLTPEEAEAQRTAASSLRTKVATALLTTLLLFYSGLPTLPVDAAMIEQTVNASQPDAKTVQLSPVEDLGKDFLEQQLQAQRIEVVRNSLEDTEKELMKIIEKETSFSRQLRGYFTKSEYQTNMQAKQILFSKMNNYLREIAKMRPDWVTTESWKTVQKIQEWLRPMVIEKPYSYYMGIAYPNRAATKELMDTINDCLSDLAAPGGKIVLATLGQRLVRAVHASLHFWNDVDTYYATYNDGYLHLLTLINRQSQRLNQELQDPALEKKLTKLMQKLNESPVFFFGELYRMFWSGSRLEANLRADIENAVKVWEKSYPAGQETTVKQPASSPMKVGGIDLRKIRYRVAFSEG